MTHPTFELLENLLNQATRGTWGPTTAPPKAPADVRDRVYVKDGKRGEPSWGAVVSDGEEIVGVDHKRYANDGEFQDYWEPGTDLYGGVLIGESFQGANGELIAEMHNALPGLLNTINALRTVAVFAVGGDMTDQIIRDAMENK